MENKFTAIEKKIIDYSAILKEISQIEYFYSLPLSDTYENLEQMNKVNAHQCG